MTKLAKLAKELEVVIFIVVHLRKEGSGRSFEQGAIPSLDDLRGSGSLKQLSWDVIALSRNQQHYDPYCRNISKITVLKCRFSGNTGEADHILFDTDTGRMRRVDKPGNYDPEE
jgi:twinkle protein